MTEKFVSNLPNRCVGQFKNPEIRKKAEETRKKNREERKRRKEAAMTGFGHSALSDPQAQAKLIDRLYEWALGDDINMAKFALKQLNDMGITKQPAEKPEVDEPDKKENMTLEDSINILMRAQREAAEQEKTIGDLEDE